MHHDKFYPDSRFSTSEKHRRARSRELIDQAIKAELQTLIDQHAEVQLPDECQARVRNGHLPECTAQTGLGDVEVKVPKRRDRRGSGIRFNSRLLPPYLKRVRSIEELSQQCTHG